MLKKPNLFKFNISKKQLFNLFLGTLSILTIAVITNLNFEAMMTSSIENILFDNRANAGTVFEIKASQEANPAVGVSTKVEASFKVDFTSTTITNPGEELLAKSCRDELSKNAGVGLGAGTQAACKSVLGENIPVLSLERIIEIRKALGNINQKIKIDTN